ALYALEIPRHVAVAGQDVQAHGRLQLLARGPEPVVVTGVKRQLRMRRLPDERALQPRQVAALELLHRMIDVIDGDHGHADEALHVRAAVVDQPVVVDAEAGFLQAGVCLGEETQPQRRVEDLGAQAVDLHLSDARARVPAAGLLLETLAQLVGRKLRRGLAVFFGYALLPQVDRLHYVRIGRNDDAVDSARLVLALCHDALRPCGG